jgi:predicted acylesterase/phospholipase RssA
MSDNGGAGTESTLPVPPPQLADSASLLPVAEDAGKDRFADQTVKVVVAFEGGGAKGIVHVGAFREIERASTENRAKIYQHWPKYELRAVAGTSMGSLIAALIAAGYRSDDMVPEVPMMREARRSFEAPFLAKQLGPLWTWLHACQLRLRLESALSNQRFVSEVLTNAELDRVMQLFGLTRFKFYLLRWFAAHTLLATSILLAIWFTAVISLHRQLIEGHPQLAIWWAETKLREHLPPSAIPYLSSFVDSVYSIAYFPSFAVLFVGILSILVAFIAVRATFRGLYSADRLVYSIDRTLARKLLPQFQRLEREAAARHDGEKLTRCRRYIKECDTALARPRRNYSPLVTFEMIKEASGLSLAMVATNIRRATIQLFSNDATPHFAVAHAVAASSAVPLLFRPVKITSAAVEELCFDGGVTSNLPTWPYDVQRAFNRDLYTLAIGIAAKDPDRVFRWWRVSSWKLFRPFYNLRDLIDATIFGARRLETRRTRTISISLDTPVRLLQFDMSAATAVMETHWASAGFRSIMNVRVSARRYYATTCLDICRAVREHLRGLPSKVILNPRIRVRLLQPMDEGARALKTVWYLSSDGSFRIDSDDRLLFRKGTSIPGRAWDTWNPQRVHVEGKPERVVWDDDPLQHRYTHPLIWKETDWMIAVAVARNPDQTHGAKDWVVVVDSNIPLANFEFSEQRGFDDVVSQITERAEKLWLLEDVVRADGKELDRQMEEAA